MSLRAANRDDLAALNKVVERAVQTWNLPERVKRLALPTYLYNEHDLQHLHIELATDSEGGAVGVAAWEAAAARDCPDGVRGLLLHGQYVDPEKQQRGIGGRLLQAAVSAAREQGYAGLLVKAQADAGGFFSLQGLQLLAVKDTSRDYPNRYWRDTGTWGGQRPQAVPTNPPRGQMRLAHPTPIHRGGTGFCWILPAGIIDVNL
jgi:predicted N-acetyltransferase YhbS